MKKKRLSDNSIIFYKLYGVNLIITVVFVCLISILCSVFSSRLVLDNMITFNRNLMSEKGKILDGRIRQLDETVNQMVGEEHVFRLMMTDEQEYQKPMEILKVIRYFQNICSNNSLIKEISLLDVNRRIVITDRTKISLGEMGDYERYLKQNSFLVTDGEDGPQLEYIKRFEPVRGKKEICFILTVNQNMFTDNLLMGGSDEMMRGYLMTSGGELLPAAPRGVNGSQYGDGVDGDVREGFLAGQKLSGSISPVEKLQWKGRNLVLYKTPSRRSDLSLLAVQDYTALVHEAGALNRVIVIASVAMILVATVIIYLCSLYVYRPLKQLGNKVSGLMSGDGQGRRKNEYNLIEDVVTGLRNEKEYTLPSVVRDSIGRLVTDPFDRERFKYLKDMLHQEMGFGLNVLVVTEGEPDRDVTHLVEGFRRITEDGLEINGFFTDITAVRCVGIFNTSLSYEAFLGKIRELKQRLDEDNGITFTCCVSRGFNNWENLSLIYSETLRKLERRFFQGKNSILCEDAPVERYKNEFYSKEIEKRLIKYVTEGACKEALETLGRLTSTLSSNAPDIQYTRFVYFQICNHVIRNVLDLGGKLPREYNEKDVFEKVFKAEGIKELEQMAEQILHVCMSNFTSREKAYSNNVEKTIALLNEKYMQDLSLDDVAGEIFISAGYLSIIFKEETGYTVMEYLTYIRMNKARELLLKLPSLKVNEISGRLGYNNVQSFIRYFKKYYGETPVAYRKNRESRGDGG